jgi:hypothetical protein
MLSGICGLCVGLAPAPAWSDPSEPEDAKPPVEEVRHVLNWVVDSNGNSKKKYRLEYRGPETSKRARRWAVAGSRRVFRQLIPVLEPTDRRTSESLKERPEVIYSAEYRGKLDMKVAEERLSRGIYAWLPTWNDPVAVQVEPRRQGRLKSKVNYRWRPQKVVQVLTLKTPWHFEKLQAPTRERFSLGGYIATLEASFDGRTRTLRIQSEIESPGENITYQETSDLNRLIMRWAEARFSGVFLFSGRDVERDSDGRPNVPLWDFNFGSSAGAYYLDLDGDSFFAFHGSIFAGFHLQLGDYLYWRVADALIEGATSRGFSMASLGVESEAGVRFGFFGAHDSPTRNFIEMGFRPGVHLPFIFEPASTVSRDRAYSHLGAHIAYGIYEPFPRFPTSTSPMTMRIFLRYRRFIGVPGIENQYILGVEAY